MKRLLLLLLLIAPQSYADTDVKFEDARNLMLTCGIIYESIAVITKESDPTAASTLGEYANVYYDLYEGLGGDLFQSNRVAQEHALNAIEMLKYGLLKPSDINYGCNKAAGDLVEMIKGE